MQGRLIIDKARDAMALWRGLLKIEPPSTEQFIRWAQQFTDAQMERAIFRCRKRFDDSSDPVTVHKYATGTLVNIRREEHEKANGVVA
jgi:hypothetical protein